MTEESREASPLNAEELAEQVEAMMETEGWTDEANSEEWLQRHRARPPAVTEEEG